MHHILVESSHHDDNEDATQKLFKKVLVTVPIAQRKGVTPRTLVHRAQSVASGGVYELYHIDYH